MNVGDKIKTVRELRKITRKDLADGLGISLQAFSNIETGEADGNMARLEKIAELLEVDIIKLLSIDENRVINGCQYHAQEVSYNFENNEKIAKLYQTLLEEKDKTIASQKETIEILQKSMQLLQNK